MQLYAGLRKTPISMRTKTFSSSITSNRIFAKQAVVILYLISAILAAFAVFLTNTNKLPQPRFAKEGDRGSCADYL